VRWNFFGLRETNSRSADVRKCAFKGESGRKKKRTIDHATVNRPKVKNKIYRSSIID
jgi:hypothetical protein